MAATVPDDVLREIFEFAAFSDTRFGTCLTSVCKEAHRWLVPRIYRSLILDNAGFLLLCAALVAERFFYAAHIRAVRVHDYERNHHNYGLAFPNAGSFVSPPRGPPGRERWVMRLLLDASAPTCLSVRATDTAPAA